MSFSPGSCDTISPQADTWDGVYRVGKAGGFVDGGLIITVCDPFETSIIAKNARTSPVGKGNGISRKNPNRFLVDDIETASSDSVTSSDGSGCGKVRKYPWRLVGRSFTVLGPRSVKRFLDLTKAWQFKEIDFEITESEYENFLRNSYIGYWNMG